MVDSQPDLQIPLERETTQDRAQTEETFPY